MTLEGEEGIPLVTLEGEEGISLVTLEGGGGQRDGVPEVAEGRGVAVRNDAQAHSTHVLHRPRRETGVGLAGRSVLGSWLGARRLFYLALFLTASRTD